MELTMNYDVNAYIDTDKVWTIEVPSRRSPAPGGHETIATGLATSWSAVEGAARDLISVWTNEPLADIDVTVHVTVPNDIIKMWQEGARAEEIGQRELQHAAKLKRGAVHALRSAGYTEAAVGKAFGVTQQRVNQIRKSA